MIAHILLIKKKVCFFFKLDQEYLWMALDGHKIRESPIQDRQQIFLSNYIC